MNLNNNKLSNQFKASEILVTFPDPHSFLGCKNLSFAATHRSISGEIVQYIQCPALPFGLLGGPIVLEDFVGNLFR
jgi:hypothetical protein